MRLRSNLSADLALVMTTLFWGTTFVLAKDVLAHWSTVSYLAGRFALAAFALVVLFWKQVKCARREELKAGTVLGVLLAVGFVLQAQGQIYTTPAKSAFVTGLTTPFVPFIAFIVLRVRPSVENLTGVALASIGGALILAPQDANGAISFSQGETNLGDALTLVSDFAFAAHVVFLSIYARRFDARQLTALQITIAAVVFCLAWLIFPTAPLVWEPRSFDVIVEATGAASGFDLAIDLLRARGTLVLKSTFHGATNFDAARIVVNELNIVGSRCGRFAPALELLKQDAVDVESLISDEFALRDGRRAFEHAREKGVLKVLLKI
jgi:drug/metabolite transporter (DMT)-like permease